MSETDQEQRIASLSHERDRLDEENRRLWTALRRIGVIVLDEDASGRLDRKRTQAKAKDREGG